LRANPCVVQSYRTAAALECVEGRDEPCWTAARIARAGKALLSVATPSLGRHSRADWVGPGAGTSRGTFLRGKGAIRSSVHRRVVVVHGPFSVAANCLGTVRAPFGARPCQEDATGTVHTYP